MIEVSRIKDEEGLLKLKDIWDELLFSSRNNSIFLTWDWIYEWFKVYGEDRQLFVLVAKDEEQNILGIAPLILKTSKSIFGKMRILEFFGTGEAKHEKVFSEFLDFILFWNRFTP